MAPQDALPATPPVDATACFCENEELLCDVYDLQHRAQCHVSDPSALCQLLSKFLDGEFVAAATAAAAGSSTSASASTAAAQGAGNAGTTATAAMDAVGRTALRYARDVLTGEGRDAHVEWWLDYGCALLAVPCQDSAPEPTLMYTLVGLDDWSFKVRLSTR